MVCGVKEDQDALLRKEFDLLAKTLLTATGKHEDWQTLHGVLGDPVSDDSCDHTADDFATFFMDKVDSQSTLILLTVQISLQISSSSQLSVCLTNWRR